MYNKIISTLLLGGSIFFLAGCGSPEVKTEATKTEAKKDSVKADSAQTKISFDRKYNDIARFIAGMKEDPGTVIDSSFLKNKEWLKFSQNMESKWEKYDNTRMKKISLWTKKEIPAKQEPFTLFYPFSGPDFLNAEIFFPTADTLVLVGLEPRGKAPEITAALKDSLPKYLNEVERSLYAILNFSFFRTNSMKVDLQSEDVNGTTPVMMLFLERTGNNVMDVQSIYIDKSGKIIHDTTTSGMIKTKGVEITFANNDDKRLRKLFYFSVDLSDGGLKNKAPEFLTFIDHLGRVSTFLKSASYLMHKTYFSVIRSVILKQSDLVLQDDSGIPVHFFDETEWDNKFYGAYTKPIPMFSNSFQEDLKKAYSDSLHVKALDFGIGYQWHLNKSNLQLSVKKKKS